MPNQSLPQRLARSLMLLAPSHPDPNDLARWEVFNTREYRQGSRAARTDLQVRSATFRYKYERQRDFFNRYFPTVDLMVLQGADVLDLGAFTGGRLIYWHEQYGFNASRGIDINPEFAAAGTTFASTKGVDGVAFDTGVGEDLPYADDTFDVVISYDVFEHVRSVETVMAECLRVLRPGGRLFAVFPQFYQPLEAHLGSVTKLPALHWFFAGETLAQAYNSIVSERGEAAYWYTRSKPKLEEWERLPTLNGITVKRFRNIVDKQDWRLEYWGRRPILTDGRRASKPFFRALSHIFAIPARLPVLEELFLGRIAVVLQSRSSA